MIKIFIAAMLSMLLVGCGGGSGGGSNTVIPQALTENDFAADPSARLAPGMVGVTFLEPKDAAPATSGDTGSPGTDEIAFRIIEQTTSTYAIDTADKTIEKITLIKSFGNEQLFLINTAQPSATVTLEPGDYKLVVYSGYTMADANGQPNRAVFLSNNTSTPAPAALGAKNALDIVRGRDDTVLDRFPGLTYRDILIVTNKCRRCNLSAYKLFGLNLSGADLSEADLRLADLSRTNLTNANLTEARLGGANLLRANLDGANLTKARLGGANLDSARLYKANLEGAALDGARMNRALLTEANLTGLNMREMELDGAILERANLTRAKLYRASLIGATLSDAILVGADLVGADLSDALMDGANLSGANLFIANLVGTILPEANLSKANLSEANLSRANLTDANLAEANLTGAKLTGAKLDRATWVDFRKCADASVGECK